MVRAGVGSKSFIESVKASLGFRAKGRDVIQSGEGYQLRVSPAPYKVLFEAEKVPKQMQSIFDAIVEFTVRDLLKMSQMDPNWCLPSKMDSNPMVWTIMYNGLIVDARALPRAIQEVAYQKGLIPYIPGDKK